MWVGVVVTAVFSMAALLAFGFGEPILGALMLIPAISMGATTVYEWRRRN